jgi:hypothetical protein
MEITLGKPRISPQAHVWRRSWKRTEWGRLASEGNERWLRLKRLQNTCVHLTSR